MEIREEISVGEAPPMRVVVYTGTSGRAERVPMVDALDDYSATRKWDLCEGCDEHLGDALREHQRTIWRARKTGERWHYYGSKAQALAMIGGH
jgi:hypothetical protein